jgi:hypothetical protein
MSRAHATARRRAALAGSVLLAALLLVAGSCATAPKKPSRPSGPAGALTDEYARLLHVHRPDLAARWAQYVQDDIVFEPLVSERLPAHERTLRTLLERTNALPASEAADTLRTRISLELTQTVAGGALHRDALLWLEIVEAAARAPFAHDSTPGCREVDRVVDQLERIPEALRGAAVMMRGTPPPDAVVLEAGLTRAEEVLRRELPRRARGCRDGRLIGRFVEADTLAAASLAGFRRLVLPQTE